MSSRLPPEPGETPTKVVVQGTKPGSPEARIIVARYQGEITHFHAKARQNRLAGEQSTQFMHQRMTNGGRMRYASINGQEVLTIEVPIPEIAEVTQLVPPPSSWWDFALVDLLVPDIPKTNAKLSAYVRPPLADDRGVTLEDMGGQVFAPGAVVEFGSAARPIVAEFVASADQTASLRVDLRPYRGRTQLDVELYGYLEVFYEGGEGPPIASSLAAQVGRRVTGMVGNSSQTGREVVGAPIILRSAVPPLDQLVGWFPELSGLDTRAPGEPYLFGVDLSARYNSGWGSSWAQDPPTWVNQMDSGAYSDVTEWWAPGIIKTRKIRGSRWRVSGTTSWTPGPVPTSGYTSGTDYEMEGYYYEFYYQPIYDNAPTPQYISRDADMQYVFCLGELFDCVTKYSKPAEDAWDTGKEFYVWQNTDMYPERWKMVNSDKKVTVATQDTPSNPTIENHFEMPYLGLLRLDLAHASVAWEPA